MKNFGPKTVAIAAAVFGVLGFAGAASAQTGVQCNTNAQGLAGDPGVVHTVICPASCGSSTVWGTGVYSDDSSVCSAAIHAGVLTTAGGAVQVTIAAGQSAYPPSTANGITTSSWGTWGRSFVVAASGASAVACNQNATTLPGDPGTSYTVTCPAGCGSSTAWGTGFYSDDSSVCTAGIHAGVTTAAGGSFNVTIAPGQTAYVSTAANGITSSQWGSWSRSFTVAP